MALQCIKLRRLSFFLTCLQRDKFRRHISSEVSLEKHLKSENETRISPKIIAQPTRGLVDEKIYIRVSNLIPNKKFTLRCLLQSEDKDLWHAYGHYISDDIGVVNVAEDVCLGGSYTGKEPNGLIWSLKPVPGSRPALRLRKQNVFIPFLLNISVHNGHINDDFKDACSLALTVMERWYIAPGVSRIEVRENGIHGTLFLPPGPGPVPGILDLWGGGGGLVEYRAALLASHGYASLALEYISTGKKSTSLNNVDLKYFEAALHFLKSHPKVSNEQIGVFGLSFGTSVALNIAANQNRISPKCLVCISGSHSVKIDGSLADVFADIEINTGKSKIDENNHVIWREFNLPRLADPSNKVKVGNIKCPLLLIAGDDDQNWIAVESAKDMENMMKAAGNEHLLTTIIYPKAGHLIEPPYSPHIRFSNYIILGEKQKVVMLWGGQTKEHSFAQEDSWEKILDFLYLHLYSSSSKL
uniref:Bile acid-CoA:amino acid N-acyltransferase-like n=1 Tax=Erpetoichthys calabaricus TaxID=27687 RepID=A0A8C4RUK5_ERPCA